MSRGAALGSLPATISSYIELIDLLMPEKTHCRSSRIYPWTRFLLELFRRPRALPRALHHGTVTVTDAECGLSAPVVPTAVTAYLYVVPVVTAVSVNFNPLTGDVTSLLYPPVPTARKT